MAKKDFSENLLGGNRNKKLDILVSSPKAVKEEKKEVVSAKKTVGAEKKTTTATTEAPATKPKAKRGRKKKGEKDSFFYTTNKEIIFEIKAAAFWERRDISNFLNRAVKHYFESVMGESELKRAVREYKKRLEENEG